MSDDELLLDEPLEEADAVECDASAPVCEVTAMEREGQAHEAEFSIREEIFETFKPTTEAMMFSPEDGMPTPIGERARDDLATAHAFTIESVACVEDTRTYVEVFVEELEERRWEHQSWSPKAKWIPPLASEVGANVVFDIRKMYAADGTTRERRQFQPLDVIERWGVQMVMVSKPDEDATYVPVRPIRERCRFYKRQNMANDDQPVPGEPGHQILFRNCTKRRSVGGAFMTLRDEAMYACDYREPFDQATVEQYLDAPDRERLVSRRHLQMVPAFNLG